MKRKSSTLISDEGGPEHHSWSLSETSPETEVHYQEKLNRLRKMQAEGFNEIGMPLEIGIIWKGRDYTVPTVTEDGRSLDEGQSIRKFLMEEGLI